MATNSRDITEKKVETLGKVPVVYYLSRNGQLEHPHFIEVPLSSFNGLYLRDVINRLNSLRGQGMASKYAWSSKRSYKNGYVWQDLSENDFIHPSQGHEYVLKGSEIVETSLSFRSFETVLSPSTSKNSPRTSSSSENSTRLRITEGGDSWSNKCNDIADHRIYRAIAAGESSMEGYNDMSTQAGEENRREGKMGSNEKAEDRGVPADVRDQMAENERPSGRIKASEVLMQFIACGSRKVKDHELVD